ncbi:sodium-coupled neutral amino acid transporter 2 [Oryzias latipes]|uniref:Sodium-coupled neutral amino acid symporter 2 n=1 Tax=Oryzias latipes TaxID=8090 RepID=H2M1K1_ORYLA|nr:sodium-coupled neutral amino acid transporter 2 [Oryzias latipes]XP_023808137.1 sodium-coupled neutral amino acid transporter 2 [Oryzias latipes]
MPNKKHTGAEMKSLGAPQEDDSSTNSSEFPYPTTFIKKKVPLEGPYPEFDPECQNFLPEHNPSKKKYETDYHQGSASFGMSVFNLGNAIMGSGILGLSFAMANTGIALFVILLVAVAIFSLYSVHLLLKTANEGGALVYEQLGYKAFGIPGKLAASCSITMQNIGAMSSYLYIVKYELPIVIQSFTGASGGEWYVNGDYLVLMVSLVIILPLSMLRNLGYLGYTSGLSLLCMVFFLIVVIIKKFQIPCPLTALEAANETLRNLSVFVNASAADDGEDNCKPKYFVYNSQTVYALPILTFAFVCHPAILPMYEELKDRSRRKMQNVANVSFLAMFIMYLLAALFGYLTFNIHVEPELLHTYSKYYKSDVLLLIVRLAVLAAVTLTVPVVLFPIRTSVNHLLCAQKEFSWIRHAIITVVLLAGTNILVIFVPSIRDIFGFIGASAAAMLIFILPSAFYIKLVKKEPLKSMQKMGAVAFLVCGIFVMCGSMTLIIVDWANNAFQKNGH